MPSPEKGMVCLWQCDPEGEKEMASEVTRTDGLLATGLCVYPMNGGKALEGLGHGRDGM